MPPHVQHSTSASQNIGCVASRADKSMPKNMTTAAPAGVSGPTTVGTGGTVTVADRFPGQRARPAPARKPRRRAWIAATIGIVLVLTGVGTTVGAYYFDSVPAPDQLDLPESTTVYYADGKTPMAKLGTENRTILPYDEMNDAVRQAIVAAEDRSFWTNKGVDFTSVLRAAKNNITGGR